MPRPRPTDTTLGHMRESGCPRTAGTWGSLDKLGPCDRRTNWLNIGRRGTLSSPFLTYSQLGNRSFCSWRDPRTGRWLSDDCTATDTDATWFLNHLNYPAQTAIAASYGLLQVTYPTAVETMGWKRGAGRGLERHPADLFDPALSLDLGAGYDADLISKFGFGGSPAPTYPDPASWLAALGRGFHRYTGGGRPNYWPEVARRAASYRQLR